MMGDMRLAAAVDEAPPASMPVITSMDDLPAIGWAIWDFGIEVWLVHALPGGRFKAVIPFMYTHAIIWGYMADAKESYEDRWCYRHQALAVAAADVWAGPPDEPDGWHRHPRSGRRRPDGDPTQEYVAP